MRGAAGPNGRQIHPAQSLPKEWVAQFQEEATKYGHAHAATGQSRGPIAARAMTEDEIREVEARVQAKRCAAMGAGQAGNSVVGVAGVGPYTGHMRPGMAQGSIHRSESIGM